MFWRSGKPKEKCFEFALLPIHRTLPAIKMKFIVKTQKPFDKYWGLLLTPIAFFDSNNNLIYYNKNYLANPLNDKNSEKQEDYFTYSKDFTIIYFMERGKYIQELYHVIIDLKNNRFKRKEWTQNDPNEKILLNLNKNQFDNSCISYFDDASWNTNLKDSIKLKSFFGLISNWKSIEIDSKK